MDSLAEEFALMTVGKFRARYRAISGTSDIHVPKYFAGGYSKKLLSIAPANLIGYWPLWETSGAVADNLQGTAARDGAYIGVTLNSSTGPDGRPVGLWDGANDYCDIYSASLNTAFSGAEGTISIWAKISAAGVWTDGAERYLYRLTVGADFLFIRKNTTNNQVLLIYKAGGVSNSVTVSSITSAGWINFALTWSKAGDAVKAYMNGVQQGATSTGLGIWSGDLASTACILGADDVPSPASIWDGYFAHAAVWTTPLTPAQILALATV